VSSEKFDKKRSSLLTGEFKSFFEKPTFECSNQMVTSLPFDFVEKLRVGKDVVLPKKWRNDVKNDAVMSESNNIKSIQLWRHIYEWKESKPFINRIYLVQYEVMQQGQNSTKSAFVTEKVATYFVQKEPWLVDPLRNLSGVRSYRKLFFGEGAKSSKNAHNKCLSTSETKTNWFFSAENANKLCAEGALANWLFHMNMKSDAEEFFRLSSNQTIDEIKRALEVVAIPKRVLDARHGIDPIEKCLWILEKQFNCRRFERMLNPSLFGSPHYVVENLRKLSLPVLISVCGKNSLYNHVVVVWRNDIFDYESKHVYPLTVENVDRICGPNNLFLKVNRGYLILPSRKMKLCVGEKSDWGELNIRQSLIHLFLN